MSKRQRFVLLSIILSIGFIVVQLLEEQYRFLSITALGVITVLLFVWSLREGLGRNMTLSTLILPLFFTVGVGLFWFLLPTSIFARIPIVIIYGLGIYALCLTSNIYTVAAIRTIALLRAARGVGFVLTLVTLFLLYDTILSIRANIVFVSGAVLLASLPLFLQGFWSISLERKLSKDVLITSLISSLILAEVVMGLYFWPVTIVVGSLFLTVVCYVLLGLGQAKIEGRLFAQTVRDYLTMGIFVFLGMFLATKWAG